VDNLHLFSRFGVQVDAAIWTAQPATTLGRCPGEGAALVVTTAATKGTANACPTTTGGALGALGALGASATRLVQAGN
jgi:hypothetical protein